MNKKQSTAVHDVQIVSDTGLTACCGQDPRTLAEFTPDPEKVTCKPIVQEKSE